MKQEDGLVYIPGAGVGAGGSAAFRGQPARLYAILIINTRFLATMEKISISVRKTSFVM
jgi:hypothetical protein